jgi:restriction system protein
MARRTTPGPIDIVLATPWWIFAVAAVVLFLTPVLAPVVLPGTSAARALAGALKDAGPIIAFVLIVIALFAAVRQIHLRKLIATCADVERIRRLHWKDFERLVAETLRRVGYRVVEQKRSLSDSGPDLIAISADETMLVRCEHRRSATVGVATVRELKEALAGDEATDAAVVTSGTFSAEAIAFASGTSIQLIDGAQLEKLILSLQPGAETPPAGTKAADSV